eukprot:TRINITY_DN1275_c2_g2_i1.p1 TRINITY_DN1275_c2_g2~~TRINITY_DN1275_c2_g2_i1.p1  ORF type:complete len:759 (+),score=284.13 TRINITY_DN1275_c2_g2_i1:44-2320(+)
MSNFSKYLSSEKYTNYKRDENIEKELEEKNDLLHIIYDNEEFRDKLYEEIRSKNWDILDKGNDYHVLAILGSQSTGKSTLLNGLFGTEFPTMNAENGRVQCTKGIWMGKSSTSPTFVLDVEGTDGKERGEEEVTFERKTSLFSLALAEVLIVNMWANDVGGYNRANLGLLKIVFEQNLQLFTREKNSRRRTLIYFILRDHIEKVTPLEKLSNQIGKDLENIWNTCKKPEEFKETKISDFFELEFDSLPHKILEEDLFKSRLKDLSNKFNSSENPKYIWKNHFKNDIPSDGFPTFAGQIWDVIKTNRDLDLPTQREALATFRCEDISEELYKEFNQSISTYSQQLRSSNIVENFGTILGGQMETTLENFRKKTLNYQEEVVSKKLNKLKDLLTMNVKDLFNTQLNLIREHSLKLFQKSIKEEFDEKEIYPDFGETAKKLVDQVVKEFFDVKISQSILKDSGWTYDVEKKDLLNAIQQLVDNERLVQIEKIMKHFEESFLKVKAEVKLLTNVASKDMWAKIREIYNKKVSELTNDFKEYFKSYALSQKEETDLSKRLSSSNFNALKKFLIEESKTINYKIEKRFDEKFKYDEKGIPREWKPESPVNDLSLQAIEAASILVDLFAVYRINEKDDELTIDEKNPSVIPEELHILSAQEVINAKHHLRTYSDNSISHARYSMESHGVKGSLTYIMIGLILILGFNEIMYVLSNPLLFMFILVFGAIIGGGYYLGLAPVALPIIFQIKNQIMANVAQALHPKKN